MWRRSVLAARKAALTQDCGKKTTSGRLFSV